MMGAGRAVSYENRLFGPNPRVFLFVFAVTFLVGAVILLVGITAASLIAVLPTLLFVSTGCGLAFTYFGIPRRVMVDEGDVLVIHIGFRRRINAESIRRIFVDSGKDRLSWLLWGKRRPRSLTVELFEKGKERHVSFIVDDAILNALRQKFSHCEWVDVN